MEIVFAWPDPAATLAGMLERRLLLLAVAGGIGRFLKRLEDLCFLTLPGSNWGRVLLIASGSLQQEASS